MNALLILIAKWFADFKDSEIGSHINSVIVPKIDNGSTLEEKEKDLLGFVLFSYSMNRGPVVFLPVQELAEGLGITDNYAKYAKDWINYSNRVKEESK